MLRTCEDRGRLGVWLPSEVHQFSLGSTWLVRDRGRVELRLPKPLCRRWRDSLPLLCRSMVGKFGLPITS